MSLTDFLVLSTIGNGAYSSVHKVKRTSDGLIYALKKVRLGNLNEKQKQNALNEVRLLASIDCQYIIKYKQAFFDTKSNTLCIVMEFADGGDLEKMISKRKQHFASVTEKEVWTILQQVGNGLSVLHEKNIIHRDIKCANIFISNSKYKLADLNVSKLMKRDKVETQTGTPYYASPEVWEDKPYELKSDIWSLGCILYELCALKPPFVASSMEGLFRKVLRGIYPRIPSMYSQKLANVIGSCLQLVPEKRPSCKQLLKMVPNEQIFESVPSVVNLLSTIKLPRRQSDWKEGLPKSDYRENHFKSNTTDTLQDRIKNTTQQQLRSIVAKVKRNNAQQDQEPRKMHHAKEERKNKVLLPIIPSQKVHSEPNDRMGVLLAKLQEEDLKRYQYNRPCWWG